MKKKIIIFAVLWLIVCFSSANAVQQMLPFPGGETWICTQGNDTTFTHKDKWKYSWDFAIPSGYPISASAGGTVVYAGYNSIIGNTIIINYGNSEYGKYCHLLNTTNCPLEVTVGEVVSQGQIIGYCGSTGSSSTGSHIHYNVQNSNSIWGESIPSSFIDVWGNKAIQEIPKQGGLYTSANHYCKLSDYRVGKFSKGDDGWRLYGGSVDSGFIPRTKPFSLTYYHLKGVNTFGHPISWVKEYHPKDNPYGCPAMDPVWIQDFSTTSFSNVNDAPLTSIMVLNPYVWNPRVSYQGVAYPLHGEMLKYWREH
ncbi:M23 family metallopeptidase, partial [Candidatus Parcubacteria bacterium]|nr:M23 family metallopeptidase [Candidatus Parcubacteria bacterium]